MRKWILKDGHPSPASGKEIKHSFVTSSAVVMGGLSPFKASALLARFHYIQFHLASLDAFYLMCVCVFLNTYKIHNIFNQTFKSGMGFP